MILLLIFGASLFGSFITTSRVAVTLANFIEGLSVNRYVILIAVLILYVILGFFMDIFALLIVSLPIIFPIVVGSLGFDSVHFGVLSNTNHNDRVH